jgi:hypothetical protein
MVLKALFDAISIFYHEKVCRSPQNRVEKVSSTCNEKEIIEDLEYNTSYVSYYHGDEGNN